MSRFLILFAFLAFATVCNAYRHRPCSQLLLPPKGLFGFPSLEEEMECESTYEWNMRLKKKQSIRLTFTYVDLRDSMITVEGKQFARDEYELIDIVEGDGNGKEVLIQPPHKFVRVTMLGIDGFFNATYEAFFCALPPPMLTEGDCNNQGYRKYSTCDFKCNSPGYFPANVESMHISARCKGDQMWSTNFEDKCVTLPEFEEMCFGANSDCPFNQGQLFEIFEKQADVTKYLALLPPPVEDNEEVPPPEDDSRTRSVHARSLPVTLETDLVAYVCNTLRACDWNTQEQTYETKCGDHKTKELQRICLFCKASICYNNGGIL